LKLFSELTHMLVILDRNSVRVSLICNADHACGPPLPNCPEVGRVLTRRGTTTSPWPPSPFHARGFHPVTTRASRRNFQTKAAGTTADTESMLRSAVHLLNPGTSMLAGPMIYGHAVRRERHVCRYRGTRFSIDPILRSQLVVLRRSYL
jgi:hypothetical protein